VAELPEYDPFVALIYKLVCTYCKVAGDTIWVSIKRFLENTRAQKIEPGKVNARKLLRINSLLQLEILGGLLKLVLDSLHHDY
jgi:hypothetical protein